MRAAQPCHAVADLAGVVAKNDWHEGVLVESQIAADAQPGETREHAALLCKAADPRLDRIIRSEPLRGIRFTRPHVINPEFVQGGRAKRVRFAQRRRLPPHSLGYRAIGRECSRRRPDTAVYFACDRRSQCRRWTSGQRLDLGQQLGIAASLVGLPRRSGASVLLQGHSAE